MDLKQRHWWLPSGNGLIASRRHNHGLAEQRQCQRSIIRLLMKPMHAPGGHLQTRTWHLQSHLPHSVASGAGVAAYTRGTTASAPLGGPSGCGPSVLLAVDARSRSRHHHCGRWGQRSSCSSSALLPPDKADVPSGAVKLHRQVPLAARLVVCGCGGSRTAPGGGSSGPTPPEVAGERGTRLEPAWLTSL